MNYQCHKSPQELLIAAGFEKAPDKGWQIVIKRNGLKPNLYWMKTLVPKSRIHATYFENNLNIHFDASINKGRAHRCFQRDRRAIEMLEKIKSLDTWTSTQGGFSLRGRLKSLMTWIRTRI